MDVVFVFVFFAIFQPVLLYAFEEQRQISKDYGNCPPFYCGKLGELTFPYTNITSNTECPFVVRGCDGEIQNIQFTGGGKLYEVESISLAGVITITDKDFKSRLNFNSCESFSNLSLPNFPDTSLQIVSNVVTLFKCDATVNITSHFDYSYQDCKEFNVYYNSDNRKSPSLLANCSIIQLPANKNNSYSDIFGLLTAKFSLNPIRYGQCFWCRIKGNICQYSTGKFQCVESLSRLNQRSRGSLKLGLGLGVPASVMIIFLSILFILYGYKRKKGSSSLLSRENKSIENFLRNNGTLAPKRYSYSEVKKMTKTFKEKLGQGGYGSVFKGNLPDGHLVAVKVLKELKSNGEDFVNEVSSIGRTSHVNIVTLLGFCFEGSKRALIYEFMSNGSLDKHIYEENLLKADRQLGWETLHQIALGIARGLEYLHRGCNTRILHFDIKPHNVLLDENFFPKISDFGLAKICPRKESIVSMLGARGTAGYIAPEVICRNFGGVSHKSDVYSYGMLVLEMIGGRRNICVEVDNTSEIYFPHWIHKRVELGEELQLRGIGNEAEGQIARKMILASLWCIQTDPSNRPPMSRVVEMLQGSLESLLIPPRPYLSSPAISPHGSIENSSSTIIVRV